jgi:hypothetical protein
MKELVTYCGYCTYLDRQMDIEIIYDSFGAIGDPNLHHKKLSCNCNFTDECPYARKTGSCEVYDSAPED